MTTRSTRVSKCRRCGLTFISVGTFDKHRVGKHPDRRCLTVDELEDAGWRQNDRGQWVRGSFTWGSGK